MNELLVKKMEWAMESFIEQCNKGNIVLSETKVEVDIDTSILEELIELYMNPYHIILYKIEGHVYGVVKGEQDIQTILAYDNKTSGDKDKFYSMPVTISFIESPIEDLEHLKNLLK